jgi:hypothetical protein
METDRDGKMWEIYGKLWKYMETSSIPGNTFLFFGGCYICVFPSNFCG